MLLNGAHHSRELTSISMTIYFTLHILFDYVKDYQPTIRLLEESAFFVIPVVNWDGFEEIGVRFQ